MKRSGSATPGTPNAAALAILKGYADDPNYLDYTPHFVTALREQGYRLLPPSLLTGTGS